MVTHRRDDGFDATARALRKVTTRRQALKIAAVMAAGGGVAALIRAPGAATPTSWNPHFTGCGAPIVTMIEQVIGTVANSCSPPGAAVPDWADMNKLQPPPYWNGAFGDFRTNYGSVNTTAKSCLEGCPCVGVHGHRIFVEIDGVVLNNAAAADDGDTGFNVQTRDTPPGDFMHQIHCEISSSWKKAGWLPTAAMPSYDATVMKNDYAGTLIDVQGLVFADLSKVPNKGVCSSHLHSVWEIHPVTAWRPHSLLGL